MPRDESPQDVQDPKFYLELDDKGELHLSKSHEYYYQVQGQLSVCEKDYCDFVCWTPKGIHVERITQDPEHFKPTKTALDSFLKALLPILLTGKPQSQSTSDGDVSSSTTSTYCWCHGGESGKMVACDNTQCPIEWFHFN